MRIAIFLPKSTPFYMSTLFAMKRGFEAHGVEVVGWTNLPESEHLIEFCRQYKPDAIIEMNRSRNDVPELPRNVRHVAWIVDAGARKLDDYRDSEVLYFFASGFKKLYTVPAAGVVDWLPPGFCSDVYRSEPASPQVEFMFAGHIPLPWTKEELDRVIYRDAHRTVLFGEVASACFSEWDKLGGLCMLQPGEVRKTIKDCMKTLAGCAVLLDAPALAYDVYVRNVRLYHRTKLMDSVLSVSDSVMLYGSENWSKWSRYAQYFNGFLSDPGELRRAYQDSSFVLHEGVGLHFRTFDCMGSGSVLTYVSSVEDDQPEGINSLFEPHRHYIPVSKENMPDVVAGYRSNERARRRIGEQAAELVHAKHTWRHRAEKILKDLRRC